MIVVKLKNGNGNAIANGIFHGRFTPMTATITLDSAGRFVLPKAIRDKMHLRSGSKLRADIVGDKIELSQKEDEVKIVRRGKRRVVVGWTGFDAAKAVREMREDQMARLNAPYGK